MWHSDVWVSAVIIPVSYSSQLELTDDFFTRFTNHLGSQSASFVKSMKFAKMLLTVLTKYQSHVSYSTTHFLHKVEHFTGNLLHQRLKPIPFIMLFQIKGEVRHTLSSCLDANETFLKKSLQAALKRISPS